MRTCFISAPIGKITASAENLLHQFGFRVVTPSDVPVGHSITEALRELVASSDLVIALWDANSPSSPNVAFEMGIAYGVGVPVLLLSPDARMLPVDLSGVLCVAADFDNSEALRFALEQLLQRPREESTKAEESRTQFTAQSEVLKALDAVRQSGPNVREREVSEAVGVALRSTSASVIQEAMIGNKLRPDFLVFDPALEALLGGPLLIEVWVATRKANVLEGVDRLQKYLAAGVARWGLLLVHPSVSPGYYSGASTTQNVLVVSVEEFLKELSRVSLKDLIRDLRNQYVHRGH